MLKELWIDVGVNRYLQYISAQGIAKVWEKKAEALLFFHAFTGCDTNSFFNVIGKKKALEIWKVLLFYQRHFKNQQVVWIF